MNAMMAAAAAAAAVAGIAGFAAAANVKPAREDRLFELRTYTASPGKIQALHTRFRDHTCKLFEKHGITNIGYWQPISGENHENTLVYMLAYPSKEAREASWKAFQADEEWKKVKAESEKDGTPLASKVVSIFMNPTDYSAIK